MAGHGKLGSMESEPLNDTDEELIEAAKAIVRERRTPGWNEVGAALRTKSGNVYRAIHLEADVGGVAVCAEAIAVGMAVSDGETTFDTIVGVIPLDGGDIEVLPPCGMCRELLNDYDATTKVIFPGGDGKLQKTQVRNLLPARWQRARTFPDPA